MGAPGSTAGTLPSPASALRVESVTPTSVTTATASSAAMTILKRIVRLLRCLPSDQAIVVEVRPKEPRASPGGVRLCGRLWRGRWVRLNDLWKRIGRDDVRRRGGRQDEQQCGDEGCRAHGRSVPLRGPESTLSDETRSSGDETTSSADRGTSRRFATKPSRPAPATGRTASRGSGMGRADQEPPAD